jgi:hypothetical protein
MILPNPNTPGPGRDRGDGMNYGNNPAPTSHPETNTPGPGRDRGDGMNYGNGGSGSDSSSGHESGQL